MATVSKTVAFYRQEGVANSTVPQVYADYPSGAHAVEVNRSFLTRYSENGIPRYSAISNATISYKIGVKNNGNSQNFDWALYYEPVSDSRPLMHGIQEDSVRTWTQITSGKFTWSPNPPGNVMTLTINVTAAMQALVNLPTWDSGSPVCFRLLNIAESGDHNIKGKNQDSPHTLDVTFTPAEEEPRERINEYENPNFTALGTENSFGHMTAFGEFPNAPTVTTGATIDGLTAPYGGHVAKITSNGGKVMTFFPNHWARKKEGWWTLGCSMYIPTGVPDIKLDWIYIAGGEFQTLRDQWIDVYIKFLFHEEQNLQLGAASRSDMAAGQAFYLANLQLYEGKETRRYADGNTADSATITNIAYGSDIGTVGSATATKIEYNGAPWTRMMPTVNNHGARILVPLASLTNGATYTASAEIAVPAGAPAANIAMDWVDSGTTTATIQPGTSQRVYVTTSRATYDSTFRFIDIVAQAGSTYYVREVMLTSGTTQHPYVGEKNGRNFLWGGGATTGTPYVAVSKPTATLNPSPTVSSKVAFPLSWNYSQPDGLSQSRVRIEFRSDK